MVLEVAHLLKYFPANSKYKDSDNFPKTLKNKENGKCLLFYLFKKPIIDKINFTQSSKVNDLENWKDINKFNEIFKNSSSSDNNNEIEEKEGELDLFSNKLPKTKLEKGRNIRFIKDYCWW